MKPSLASLTVLLSGLAAAQTATPPSDMDTLLSALNKSLRFAVRGETSITVIFPPRDPPVRQAQSLPPIKVYPKLLRQNFMVKREAAETVAGRSTQVFSLTPKLGAAASWRVWVDVSWNVPLAYEERSADGSLARRAELLSAVKLQKRAAPIKAELLAGLPQALSLALPGLNLPAGFVAAGVGQRKTGTQLNLSDGINVVALVMAPKGVKAAAGVASRKVGDSFVWLVGNLDTGVLKTSLSSVKRSDPGPLGTFLPPSDSNP
ncbi:transcriptional regulator [Deinococcus detaillensis]|uniref:Transcriptional regulator n=1 Tax=Deinococcus detaillensis TaxID=2592048 RepID=A0A553V420_9DEIO|nr:transcriptional regulator [Deinococcus detaillensis]TSA87196.1 transcriptional regulator [Deinococcus detaillensis]